LTLGRLPVKDTVPVSGLGVIVKGGTRPKAAVRALLVAFAKPRVGDPAHLFHRFEHAGIEHLAPLGLLQRSMNAF
jgi:hypothetical protein